MLGIEIEIYIDAWFSYPVQFCLFGSVSSFFSLQHARTHWMLKTFIMWFPLEIKCKFHLVKVRDCHRRHHFLGCVCVCYCAHAKLSPLPPSSPSCYCRCSWPSTMLATIVPVLYRLSFASVSLSSSCAGAKSMVVLIFTRQVSRTGGRWRWQGRH